MKSEEFLSKLQSLLDSANTHMGRKTQNRKNFVDSIMQLAKQYVDEKNTQQTNKQKARQRRLMPMNDRAIKLKPSDQNKIVKKKDGTSVMTEADSMAADEEMGNSPL